MPLSALSATIDIYPQKKESQYYNEVVSSYNLARQFSAVPKQEQFYFPSVVNGYFN